MPPEPSVATAPRARRPLGPWAPGAEVRSQYANVLQPGIWQDAAWGAFWDPTAQPLAWEVSAERFRAMRSHTASPLDEPVYHSEEQEARAVLIDQAAQSHEACRLVVFFSDVDKLIRVGAPRRLPVFISSSDHADVLWPSAELVCATLYRNGVPNGLPSGRHLLWKCELFAPLGLRTVSAPASSQYGNSCEETWKPLVTVAVAKKRAQQCSLLGWRSVSHATFSSLIVGTAASFETAPR